MQTAPVVPAATGVPYTDWNVDRTLFTGRPSWVNQVFNGALWVLEQFTSHAVSAPSASTSTTLTQASPPWYSTLGLTVSQTEYHGMPVYTLAPASPTESVVVAVHGGGYVSQPLVFEWLADGAIARQTGATVVVPMYPLAGDGGTAATVVPQMADFLTSLVDAHGAQHVSLMGVSAGGGLALAATQELVRRGATTPGRMVLISPWLDATVSDPASETIWDPLLDVSQLQSFGRQWAAGLDPADPRVSPLYGSLAGLPPTTVYSGSFDLLAPDTVRLRQQAIAHGLDMTFVLRDRQFHGWPLFIPLPDAVRSLPAIEAQLGLTASTPAHGGAPGQR
ncbi:alpha/beta hydrolase [Mycobacterium sp. DL592]|uniref:alpha/beta hydrolase n=1 Tax=Mycobacterium sp. DL592 TaxID=2675524 RepID=UPI0014238E12|nr:alpha/beta hydrolase [Mycobacterium sp. DL592]